MADISKGPVSTLPYSRHQLPLGTMCDRHPKRGAVARIQGETDSFGCEYNDLCQQCLEEIRAYQNSAQARSGGAKTMRQTYETVETMRRE